MGRPHHPWRLPLGEDRSGSPMPNLNFDEAKRDRKEARTIISL
nr:hypothetical protein [Nostoc sp. DedSLP04]